MNWLLYHIISGQVIFTGAIVMTIAVLWPPKKRGSILLLFLAGTGLAATSSSAVAIPLVIFFALATINWIVWLIAAGKNSARKKTLVASSYVLLTAIAVICLLEANKQITPQVTAGNGPIIVVGDSISAGLSRKTIPWPDLLAQNSGVTVINASSNGADVRTAIGNAQKALADRNEPATVIVEIGGNDMIRGYPAEEFQADLRELMKTVCRNGNKIIMLELPLLPFKFEYSYAQRAVASEYDVTLIPRRIFASVITGGDTTVDGLHLSDVGTAKMARKIADVLNLQSVASKPATQCAAAQTKIATFGWIALGYLAIAFLYWLKQAVGSFKIWSVREIGQYNPPENLTLPKLSVIVPACNEGDKIRQAVGTLAAQDYPDMEIILIDDRSDDDTGKIIDEIAANDTRIKPIHIAELPTGWLGKVHAISIGVKHAAGEFLLFADADVHYKPLALKRTLAKCIDEKLDHLTLLPSLWPATIIADICVASFLRQLMLLGVPPWRVNEGKPNAFFGVGAFNLVRAQALNKSEGLEWLKMETADDMGLAMLMRRAGAKSAVMKGQDAIIMHWYRNMREMMRGSEKSFASLGNCNPINMAIMGIVSLLLEIAPLAAVATVIATVNSGVWSLLAITLTSLGTITTVMFLITTFGLTRWAGGKLLIALLTPLVGPVNLAMICRAAWLGWRRGGVMWRNSLYPSADLKAGKRIKF